MKKQHRYRILLLIFTCLLSMIASQTFASNNSRFISPQIQQTENISGRWDDAQVLWYYNGDNAPYWFKSNRFTLSLIESAMKEWQGVSGIQFVYQGTTSANPVSIDDDKVVIGWDDFGSGGPSGVGGPVSSCLISKQQIVSNCHFVDGSVRLNLATDWGDLRSIYRQKDFVRVMVHELAHLLGLNHSDNPQSVMFASPYNHLHHPRESDVKSMQALYGSSKEPYQSAKYNAPPAGREQHLENAYFMKDLSAWNKSVKNSTNDAHAANQIWLVVKTNGSNRTYNAEYEVVTVDPSGHFYAENTLSISCKQGYRCNNATTIAIPEILQTIPGTWITYVIHNNKTLLTRKLKVNTDSVVF